MSAYLIIVFLLTASVLGVLDMCSLQRRQLIKYSICILAIIALGLIITENTSIIPDTYYYIKNFDDTNIHSSILNVQPNYYGFERGFMGLTLAIKRVINNPYAYLFIVFLIDYASLYIAGRNLSIFNLGTPVYFPIVFLSLWFSYFGLFYGLIVIRAGLAMSLAFLGYSFLIRRKYVRCIIFALIALLFQSSIIIFIIGILVGTVLIKTEKKNTYYIWWFVCLALWVSRISLLFSNIVSRLASFLGSYIPAFSKYNMFYINTMGNGFLSKKNMLFLLLALIFIILKPENDKSYNTYLKMFMIGLTITYLTNELSTGYRISDMFLIFSVPLSYNIVTINTGFSQKSKFVFYIMLLIIFIIIASRIIKAYI